MAGGSLEFPADEFEPDYRMLEMAARNTKPPRLPLYEHLINAESMADMLDVAMDGQDGPTEADRREFFEQYCGFYRKATYDTVSYEVCVTDFLPGGGALLGEREGPIQNRDDYDRYPWDDLPRIFWDTAKPRFDMLREYMPAGMKAVGGVGNGPFEISEDLVGYQQLCLMLADDPELLAMIYVRIGDLLVDLWTTLLEQYSDVFCVCRIGDDMGFKTSTLLAPQTILDHIMPQYRRIISVIHSTGKPYLQHSCGKIFDVMEGFIEAGIDAKHSNEDAIAPFDEWISRYGDRIALFGGIDTDRLCQMKPDDVYSFVVDEAGRFRANARGYALGSGNSIPPYVPAEGYRAMLLAAGEIRRRECAGQ